MNQQTHSKRLCEELILYGLDALDAEEVNQVEESLRGANRQVAQDSRDVHELVGLLGHLVLPASPPPRLRRRLFDRLGWDEPSARTMS